MTTPTTTQELIDRLEVRAREADRRRAGAEFNGMPFMAAEDVETALLLRTTKVRLYELQDEVVRLRERIAKLETPEWFYNADDGEYSYGDVADAVDDMGYHGVMLVGGAREVWRRWAAVRCVALDDEGDIDETEVEVFDNELDAMRCWPDSLAACRARAALDPQPQAKEQAKP